MPIITEREPLTAERLRELVSYDADTGIMRWIARGKGRRVGDAVGARNSKGALVTKINQTILYVHRLAWLYMTGEWPAVLVDHINGDPADNRWCNLRAADYIQNGHNRKRHRNNTSGFKNVAWDKKNSRWEVILWKDGKNHRIGRFLDKADAIAASREAMRRLHGEFARFE